MDPWSEHLGDGLAGVMHVARSLDCDYSVNVTTDTDWIHKTTVIITYVPFPQLFLIWERVPMLEDNCCLHSMFPAPVKHVYCFTVIHINITVSDLHATS